jgi:hypothetical protein
MAASGSTAVAELVAHAPLARTWHTVTPLTPVGYFPKSGLLPAVLEVRNQTGNWDAPGQSRKLMLSDGGSVIESTTDVAPFSFFAYELTEFQKIFGKLVDHARTEWTFTEVPAGTNIHWTYTFFPRNAVAKSLLAVIVSLLWRPYMKKVLSGIVAEVERQRV